MLQVEGLDAWYDHAHVVQGLSFEVRTGEIVTLMGRNGAGKTSTLRAIMGLMAKRAGRVRFDGREMLAEPAHARYHRGLAYVPEERRIVPGLTVRENLRHEGTTILLVEQNVERALSISDRAYILDQGRIVHQGDAAELLADREIQERYCAV
jgi:ABC-type branched-subunit amino acid transport system ATPase component